MAVRKKSSASELAACPHCRTDEHLHTVIRGFDGLISVHCTGCNTYGPPAQVQDQMRRSRPQEQVKAEAHRLWNENPALQEQRGLIRARQARGVK